MQNSAMKKELFVLETKSDYKYVINMDLTPFVRSDMNKKRIWDLTSKFKVNSRVSLLDQHGDRELLEGPLHMDCTFYLKFRGSIAKSKEFQDLPHLCRPYLSGLLLLLEAVGVDIIFKSASSIMSIDTRKYYDSENPRVEFMLFETKKEV